MGFVDDNTSLTFPKVDRRSIPPGESATKFIRAADFNELCQGATDTRDWIRAATWYGLAAQAADPAPAGITNYIWLKDDGTLWKTIDGTASQIGAGGGTVATDGVTITGDGSVGDPLVAVEPGGWTTLVQASDQDVTNAQDQNSNTFTFSVTAGADYSVFCYLYFSSSNSSNDAEYRFALSTGTMLGRGITANLNASDAATLSAVSAVAAANTNQIAVGCWTGLSSPPVPVMVHYSFQPTSTGTFKLQFGNNVTGSGIVSRIHAGSIMRYKSL